MNPTCDEDVFIALPDECGAGPSICGKLLYWLCGFRPAAAAWEKLFSRLLESLGFEKGQACGVAFYHPGRDIALAVHGDDCKFSALREDVKWISDPMKSWFEIKVRAILGGEEGDDKEVVLSGRRIRWTEGGLEWEADKKSRDKVEYFGFLGNSGMRGVKPEQLRCNTL